jgi:hypothetical protein
MNSRKQEIVPAEKAPIVAISTFAHEYSTKYFHHDVRLLNKNIKTRLLIAN